MSDFTTQVHSERARNSRSYVSHEKYILNAPHDPQRPELKDLVVCLVVRRNIPMDTSVSDLTEHVEKQSGDIEQDLREMTEEYGWLR